MAVVHGRRQSISPETAEVLFAFRYRSHFHLSEAQYEQESDDAKFFAQAIWTLEAQRDNLKKKRQDTIHN